MISLDSTQDQNQKLILQGIHLDLTEAMKSALAQKAERIFRHRPDILRLRIEVDAHGQPRAFTAKGHIEIAGPDLQASVTSPDAYTSINLLVDKLDRLLRKRNTAILSRRPTDDIRSHPMATD